jgi:hypothetical protein
MAAISTEVNRDPLSSRQLADDCCRYRIGFVGMTSFTDRRDVIDVYGESHSLFGLAPSLYR